MSVPVRNTILVIDRMAFRRAQMVCFLEPWAKSENTDLLSLDPDEAHARLVECGRCRMLLYAIGASTGYETLAEVQVLHTLSREAPIVLVADEENPSAVIAAINSRVQGYLSNSMAPGLALQALSFVLHGGTYFPPQTILAGHAQSVAAPTMFHEQPAPYLEQQDQQPFIDDPCGQQATPMNGKAAGVEYGNGRGGVRLAPQFTERQYAVLACLSQGDSNKVIGRKLGMTETTVKVHVREIMRKLGVSNRTQVALAGRDSIGLDNMTEIIAREPETGAASH